jgi:hypothetical protein
VLFFAPAILQGSLPRLLRSDCLGLNPPLYAKKLKRWCKTVSACSAGTNEMLPSSSASPETVALVSSEALPAMTDAERLSQHVMVGQ